MSLAPRHVLVTGATGFVGAHVVDLLLERGIKVTGTARSQSKANEMKSCRKRFGDLFSMSVTGDLAAPNVFDNVMQGVDVVIHVASPVPDGTGVLNFERDIILPAIKGIQSILKSVEKSQSVKRVILTSSFGALVDASRDPNESYTYTSEDWNPITYEGGVSAPDFATAYRASKKFAELEAWNWVRSPSSVNAMGEKVDLTVFCAPLVIGPWVHPVKRLSSINTSMQAHRDMIMGVPSGAYVSRQPPVWVDVRDLALAHVEAAYIRPETSNKRFVVCSPEKRSFSQDAEIIKRAFPEWAGRIALPPGGSLRPHVGLDGSPLTKEVGIRYTSLRECVVALAKQIIEQGMKEGLFVPRSRL